MKKILSLAFILSAFTMLITSCSTTRSVVNGGATRARFVGTWTVTNVGYDGIVENAVQNIFDQMPPAAFNGSRWQLTNSGNGQYTLSDGTSQAIFWSLYNGNDSATRFQFKKIYEGDKAKNVNDGYRLDIGSNDGKTMVLRIPIPTGGRTGYVVLTFIKK